MKVLGCPGDGNTLKEFEKLTKDLKAESLVPQDFEKDNDANYHIDYIYSIANVRATNYKLDEMSWLDVTYVEVCNRSDGW